MRDYNEISDDEVILRMENVDRQVKMQRQDSTYDQMKTVYKLAMEAGCYDAANQIKKILIDPVTERLKEIG
jgi:hypothetical protein